MDFNQYNLYALNSGMKVEPKTDIIDTYIKEIRNMGIYEEIRDYLTEHFGNFHGEKWVEYPELNKEVFMRLEDDKIEFCALKNQQQYFGQGWKLISGEKL